MRSTPIQGSTRPFGRHVTAVTGPSGSGKTTLLHLLAGLDLPDEGDVLVDGTSLRPRPCRPRRAAPTLRLCRPDAGLVPFLGARENVEMALELRGADRRRGRAITAVGLDEHAERPVSELSAGQRVRAALARALPRSRS